MTSIYDNDDFEPYIESDPDLEELAQLSQIETKREPVLLAKMPLFETLFRQSVPDDDPVLGDFAQHVVGPLSDHFGLVTAKGGAFFRQKEAEGAKNSERYSRDQTLRAHLINGMLPARHVARQLCAWGSHTLRHWDERAERVFIAGYMLHDFTKIKAAKQTLLDAGFAEMEGPSERQIPVLRRIFAEWCGILGLDAFLDPVAPIETLLDDLIYVATNTQRLAGRAASPHLLSPSLDKSIYMASRDVSHLADLIAYVAPTPREAVSHPTLAQAVKELAYSKKVSSGRAGKLVYHHVAENRGLLLNFIHNAVIDALRDEARVPILFAPSGVVYLERHDAPPMPSTDELVERVVRAVRQKADERLKSSGKGAKRGNVGLQIDDSYNDFFDLRDLIRYSPHLVEKHIKNNKTADRLAPVKNGAWLGDDAIPDVSPDPKDARYDQIAEWAGLLENQFRDRLGTFDFTAWALANLGLEDLRPSFEAIRNHPEAKKGGGIKFWWFWAATHVLKRQIMREDRLIRWLSSLSHELANALPAELPLSAQVNDTTWHDLAAYVGQVLTVGGAKSGTPIANEAARYTRAKAGRGGAVCAVCGSDYATRKPAETAVSFQPGVYTGRIKIGASDNKRNLCSICALEQLLRQLFMDNLDSGGTAEGQRIRYLTFYPSYFFTPETLRFIKLAYSKLRDIRISDKDLRRALRDQDDLKDERFWQRLEPFLMRAPDEDPSKRVLRYHEDAQATFFMVGFRNFNDPTDTESWVMPAFLALVLSVCLDVKVVASESGMPLLVEASELQETIWFDGLHAAVRALVGQDRLRIDDDDRKFTDLPTALARLTAAYMIHLDSEYTPPKEHWQRFVPIANALMESPLYVFHYLKKQAREDGPVGAAQVARYIRYADELFTSKGDMSMSHARELVRLYAKFYRVNEVWNASSYTILRPIDIVADTLLNLDPRLFEGDDALIEVACGTLHKRLVSSETNAIYIQNREAGQALQEFCRTFVHDVFIGVFKGDVAALRGKQLNLLRNACEYLYLQTARAEIQARRAASATSSTELTDSSL